MNELTVTTYGPGGFDPEHETGNVVAEAVVSVEQRPLDAVGALATLLAVTEVIPVEQVAEAVGLPVAALVAEAEAWAAASSVEE